MRLNLPAIFVSIFIFSSSLLAASQNEVPKPNGQVDAAAKKNLPPLTDEQLAELLAPLNLPGSKPLKNSGTTPSANSVSETPKQKYSILQRMTFFALRQKIYQQVQLARARAKGSMIYSAVSGLAVVAIVQFTPGLSLARFTVLPILGGLGTRTLFGYGRAAIVGKPDTLGKHLRTQVILTAVQFAGMTVFHYAPMICEQALRMAVILHR